MLSRRTKVSEDWLQSYLLEFNAKRYQSNPIYFTAERLALIKQRNLVEQQDLENNIRTPLAQSALKPGETQGRISGSEEWKQSRGEAGGSCVIPSGYWAEEDVNTP